MRDKGGRTLDRSGVVTAVGRKVTENERLVVFFGGGSKFWSSLNEGLQMGGSLHNMGFSLSVDVCLFVWMQTDTT